MGGTEQCNSQTGPYRLAAEGHTLLIPRLACMHYYSEYAYSVLRNSLRIDARPGRKAGIA
jgi:hypothetical protein